MIGTKECCSKASLDCDVSIANYCSAQGSLMRRAPVGWQQGDEIEARRRAQGYPKHACWVQLTLPLASIVGSTGTSTATPLAAHSRRRALVELEQLHRVP